MGGPFFRSRDSEFFFAVLGEKKLSPTSNTCHGESHPDIPSVLKPILHSETLRRLVRPGQMRGIVSIMPAVQSRVMSRRE